MKMKTLLFACITLVGLAAHAADGHKHAEAAPKYGGQVKEVDEVQYELVAKPDRLTLYVDDHGKKADAKGMTAKVTLRNGSERTEVNLQPTTDNKLEATGNFKVTAGTVAIAQMKLPGKGEQSVRFTLK